MLGCPHARYILEHNFDSFSLLLVDSVDADRVNVVGVVKYGHDTARVYVIGVGVAGLSGFLSIILMNFSLLLGRYGKSWWYFLTGSNDLVFLFHPHVLFQQMFLFFKWFQSCSYVALIETLVNDKYPEVFFEFRRKLARKKTQQITDKASEHNGRTLFTRVSSGGMNFGFYPLLLSRPDHPNWPI